MQAAAKATEEKERTIERLAGERAKKKTRYFKGLQATSWLAYLFGGIILAGSLIVWLFELQPAYRWAIKVLPDKLTSSSEFFAIAYTVFAASIGLLALACQKIISYLGSEERYNKLYNKFYKEYSKLIEEEIDNDLH